MLITFHDILLYLRELSELVGWATKISSAQRAAPTQTFPIARMFEALKSAKYPQTFTTMNHPIMTYNKSLARFVHLTRRTVSREKVILYLSLHTISLDFDLFSEFQCHSRFDPIQSSQFCSTTKMQRNEMMAFEIKTEPNRITDARTKLEELLILNLYASVIEKCQIHK